VSPAVTSQHVCCP